MKQFGFEKLVVWQKSKSLSLSVYLHTKDFPSEEKFGLVSQMRRASLSISSNIAEGSARYSKDEKARFTEIAYGSAIELLNQIEISKELGFLSLDNHLNLRKNISEITAMLDGLYKFQKK